MDELLVEAIRDNIQKYGYSLDPVDLLQNVKAALVAEGWKSPEEVDEIVAAKSIIYARAGELAVNCVRIDERQAISQFLNAHGCWRNHYNTPKAGYELTYEEYIQLDALLKGGKAVTMEWEQWSNPKYNTGAEEAQADAEGAIYKAGADAERARIVGLFDAADEIDGSLSHIVSAYSGIIEGLREKK
jgi:hypothetical protein